MTWYVFDFVLFHGGRGRGLQLIVIAEEVLQRRRRRPLIESRPIHTDVPWQIRGTSFGGIEYIRGSYRDEDDGENEGEDERFYREEEKRSNIYKRGKEKKRGETEGQRRRKEMEKRRGVPMT